MANTSKRRWYQLFRLTPIKAVIMALAVPVFLMVLSSGAWGERRFQRCVLCRVVHIQHRYAGFGWESERENACSTWYRDDVAERHEHFWVGCSTPISMQNGFGQNIGAGSNDDNHPAQLLTPEEQISVYQHIGDVKAATNLFLELGVHQRAHRREALAIASSLKQWVEEDQFQTPWREWRRKIDADVAAVQTTDGHAGNTSAP